MVSVVFGLSEVTRTYRCLGLDALRQRYKNTRGPTTRPGVRVKPSLACPGTAAPAPPRALQTATSREPRKTLSWLSVLATDAPRRHRPTSLNLLPRQIHRPSRDSNFAPTKSAEETLIRSLPDLRADSGRVLRVAAPSSDTVAFFQHGVVLPGTATGPRARKASAAKRAASSKNNKISKPQQKG